MQLAGLLKIRSVTDIKKYIEIELQLGNINHGRKLYEKYLEWSPENCYAWSKYEELERSLCETGELGQSLSLRLPDKD
uniref:Uncharacterized protein n=1 Tax=Quercus lobata TaxID=97700 RepID=A0A7N2KVI7_QUELO